MAVGRRGVPTAIVGTDVSTSCVVTHDRERKPLTKSRPRVHADHGNQFPKTRVSVHQNSGLGAPFLESARKTSSVSDGVCNQKSAQMSEWIWWSGQRDRVKDNTVVCHTVPKSSSATYRRVVMVTRGSGCGGTVGQTYLRNVESCREPERIWERSRAQSCTARGRSESVIP